jgi:beta-N-acetylhexosaminidase
MTPRSPCRLAVVPALPAIARLLPALVVSTALLVLAVGSLAACAGGGPETPAPSPAPGEGVASDLPGVGAAAVTLEGGPASVTATVVATRPRHLARPRPHRSPPVLSLTTRQLAGQRVIYSYPGLTPPRELLDAIRAGEAAGVILFAENIASRAQIRRVIARLQKAAARSPIAQPLLIMVDQEGGYVRRLPGEPFASHKTIGLSADPTAAAGAAGRAAGLNLRGAGFNVNLGPVLDVARPAGGFIDDARRSFGTDPALVGGLGAAFVDAQQRTGVAATAKHFPGLGAGSSFENTDHGPATMDVPLATLRSVDEAPYEAAIAAGLRLVMASWAVYPALDDRPAGLSPVVIGEELRGRLGFTGVTVTDSLGVAGLRGYGPIEDRALLATEAGMDLLLCAGRKLSEGTRAVDALARALERDQLDGPAYRAAVRRVLALRADVD